MRRAAGVCASGLNIQPHACTYGPSSAHIPNSTKIQNPGKGAVKANQSNKRHPASSCMLLLRLLLGAAARAPLLLSLLVFSGLGSDLCQIHHRPTSKDKTWPQSPPAGARRRLHKTKNTHFDVPRLKVLTEGYAFGAPKIHL